MKNPLPSSLHPTLPKRRYIYAGYIEGAHGVRGQIKLRSLMENPETLAQYNITNENGEVTFKIKFERKIAEDRFIAKVDNINDRNKAQKMRGQKLYIARDDLPTAGERIYYNADLIGLNAKDASGKNFGKVLAVHNFGGGSMLEIGNDPKTSFMLPFSDYFVPEINIEAANVKIVIPEGWHDSPPRSKF